jgi:CheY-like chemotaxis protein
VLLDLRLPRLDGIQVLSEIRNNPETKKLPVVVLTSSKEERDLIKTYELGVNSFVAKPVEFEQFATTVSKLGLYWVLVNQIPQDVVE